MRLRMLRKTACCWHWLLLRGQLQGAGLLHVAGLLLGPGQRREAELLQQAGPLLEEGLNDLSQEEEAWGQPGVELTCLACHCGQRGVTEALQMDLPWGCGSRHPVGQAWRSYCHLGLMAYPWCRI